MGLGGPNDFCFLFLKFLRDEAECFRFLPSFFCRWCSLTDRVLGYFLTVASSPAESIAIETYLLGLCVCFGVIVGWRVFSFGFLCCVLRFVVWFGLFLQLSEVLVAAFPVEVSLLLGVVQGGAVGRGGALVLRRGSCFVDRPALVVEAVAAFVQRVSADFKADGADRLAGHVLHELGHLCLVLDFVEAHSNFYVVQFAVVAEHLAHVRQCVQSICPGK